MHQCDGQAGPNSYKKPACENQRTAQNRDIDHYCYRGHSVSGIPCGCAGSFQASTAASILPTILHHPADGGSNRVFTGSVEYSTFIAIQKNCFRQNKNLLKKSLSVEIYGKFHYNGKQLSLTQYEGECCFEQVA